MGSSLKKELIIEKATQDHSLNELVSLFGDARKAGSFRKNKAARSRIDKGTDAIYRLKNTQEYKDHKGASAIAEGNGKIGDYGKKLYYQLNKELIKD